MLEDDQSLNYRTYEIIKNNVHRDSKIPHLLIERAEKRKSFSLEMIEVIIKYEEITPSIEGQKWLITNCTFIDEKYAVAIRQLFKNNGFFNEEIERLYNKKYKD